MTCVTFAMVGESIETHTLTWKVGASADGPAGNLKKSIGETLYKASKAALQRFLCDYFRTSDLCNVPQGASITPLGGGTNGYKRLKVRWSLPGSGKSGSLRLGVSVKCKERTVLISSLRHRPSNPSASEMTADFDSSELGP